MSGDAEGLVKLTVNLTPKAHRSLGESAARTGITWTDTVNRALSIYAEIVDVASDSSGVGQVQFSLTDDSSVVLLVKREIAPRA